MKIYIGADHGGFSLKKQLIAYLNSYGHKVTDVGAYELNPQDDYPDIVHEFKSQIQGIIKTEPIRGIFVCSSGIGMSIAMNKIDGVRAAFCSTPEMAYFGRIHNDINILCLAGLRSSADSIEKITDGRYSNLIDAGMIKANLNKTKRIINVFLNTETEAVQNSRHKRRNEKISQLETED